LTVTQIVTPRPQFNDEYEKLIEERNSLGNQLEVIKSNLAAAQTTRDRKLAEVNRDQNRLIQEKRTELESGLASAVAEQANNTREADTYKIAAIGQGQAERSAAPSRPSSCAASSTPSTAAARPRSTRSAPSRSSA
jgi:peptidoglycan hydrolase CwlO-like protein